MNKFLITATITACVTINQVNAQKSQNNNVLTQQKGAKETKEIEKAKLWITRVVAHTLNKVNGLAENTNDEAEGKHKKMYTDQYIAYKDDAAEVGSDGGMTLNAFKKKWAKDFNCEYAGIGNSYLVSGTDYGLIEVSHCVFRKKIGTAYVFETIITDTEAKIDYKRDIIVIPSGNTFLIKDVLEYN
ncbi:hypothetical protein [Chryseobacterium sp. 52]|uniref:hypothetical protein n=1 Tax=Chryseobacterium sp. 52 TaxID=2035213 RepID=UPI001180E911|nr:hypothetical protein [Chryseobacterium sp. 52]